mmetsp:Transcript_40412/g.49008  ORF Transcript_40412/g.49008 Transcript_40412/m.49008 type:complete len:243 (-) Transcript_40412:340-1068(-)
MSHTSENQLLVVAPRHEVNTAATPSISYEGHVKVVTIDPLVANMDTGWVDSDREVKSSTATELVAPGASSVDNKPSIDCGAVCHLHSSCLVTFNDELVNLAVELNVDSHTLAHLQGVIKGGVRVNMSWSFFVERGEGTVVLFKEVTFFVELRERLCAEQGEALLEVIFVQNSGVHTVIQQPLRHGLVLALIVAQHPQGTGRGEGCCRLVISGVCRPVLVSINTVQSDLHGFIETVEGAQETS